MDETNLPPITDADLPPEGTPAEDMTAEESLAYLGDALREAGVIQGPIYREHNVDPRALALERAAIDAEDRMIFGDSVSEDNERRTVESN